jgi:large subunit ribosomal protein L3
MHGQHGNKKVTTKGLQIAKILSDQKLVLIKGAVPGANGGLVTLHKSAR